MIGIEDEFSIRFPTERLPELHTVGDVGRRHRGARPCSGVNGWQTCRNTGTSGELTPGAQVQWRSGYYHFMAFLTSETVRSSILTARRMSRMLRPGVRRHRHGGVFARRPAGAFRYIYTRKGKSLRAGRSPQPLFAPSAAAAMTTGRTTVSTFPMNALLASTTAARAGRETNEKVVDCFDSRSGDRRCGGRRLYAQHGAARRGEPAGHAAGDGRAHGARDGAPDGAADRSATELPMEAGETLVLNGRSWSRPFRTERNTFPADALQQVGFLPEAEPLQNGGWTIMCCPPSRRRIAARNMSTTRPAFAI